MPFSTIFQLYRDGTWENHWPVSQVTFKLYHIMSYQVHLAMVVIQTFNTALVFIDTDCTGCLWVCMLFEDFLFWHSRVVELFSMKNSVVLYMLCLDWASLNITWLLWIVVTGFIIPSPTKGYSNASFHSSVHPSVTSLWTL